MKLWSGRFGKDTDALANELNASIYFDQRLYREDIEAVPELKVLAASPEAGVYAVKTEGGRQVYLMGHAEYDRDTLKKEYLRDVAAGLPIDMPKNYFPDDDPTKEPIVTWRGHANLIYSNWLNYFVYQTTPYDIETIE